LIRGDVLVFKKDFIAARRFEAVTGFQMMESIDFIPPETLCQLKWHHDWNVDLRVMLR